MPSSVRYVTKFAGIFVAPFVELNFERNWFAWFGILMAMNVATV